MFTKCTVLLITLFLNYSMLAQESNSTDYITVVAELIGIESTAKVHNSYFFTFNIKEVLSGETNDSILVSQEIFQNKGANQIFYKICPNENINEYESKKGQEVLIKYSHQNSKLPLKSNCHIIWVAEKFRRKSLENLEILLESYYANKRNKKMSKYNLLCELGGKLFFSNNDKNAMVAVETYPGDADWVIAKIDKHSN